MKIGTSLGKCVKSLLDGTVAYDDVLFVVANTRGEDEEKLREIMDEYYYGYATRNPAYDLSAYTASEAQDMAVKLFKDGKLFQPRLHINSWGNAHGLQDTWYDILPSEGSSAAAKNAWDAYVMMSKLSQ